MYYMRIFLYEKSKNVQEIWFVRIVFKFHFELHYQRQRYVNTETADHKVIMLKVNPARDDVE